MLCDFGNNSSILFLDLDNRKHEMGYKSGTLGHRARQDSLKCDREEAYEASSDCSCVARMLLK